MRLVQKIVYLCNQYENLNKYATFHLLHNFGFNHRLSVCGVIEVLFYFLCPNVHENLYRDPDWYYS